MTCFGSNPFLLTDEGRLVLAVPRHNLVHRELRQTEVGAQLNLKEEINILNYMFCCLLPSAPPFLSLHVGGLTKRPNCQVFSFLLNFLSLFLLHCLGKRKIVSNNCQVSKKVALSALVAPTEESLSSTICCVQKRKIYKSFFLGHSTCQGHSILTPT